MNVPAIAKILIVFFGMLGLTRIKIPLGISILLGGIVMTVWAGKASEAGPAVLEAVSGSGFWLLVVITSLIFEFGRFLSEPENSRQVVAAAHRLGGKYGRICSLIAVPAAIGLVPMPAGALFSAPLVGQAAGDHDCTPEWKTVVNYWFRHSWEYWWPLYPGIIMTLSIFEMDTTRLILGQIVFTPIAMAIGYLVLMRPHAKALTATATDSTEFDSRRFTIVAMPVLITIACVFFLPPVMETLFPVLDGHGLKLASMLTGILAGLAMIYFEERRRNIRGVFLRAAFSRKSLNVVLTVAGVLVFQALLDKSGLLPVARDELQASGIHVTILVAMLPFLAGLVTGIALGFVGTSFPLVVMLAAPGTGDLPQSATLALAFGFGYMGMMLSPIHLCLVVSRQYFSASPLRLYKYLAPCAGAVTVFAVVMFLVYRQMEF